MDGEGDSRGPDKGMDHARPEISEVSSQEGRQWILRVAEDDARVLDQFRRTKESFKERTDKWSQEQETWQETWNGKIDKIRGELEDLRRAQKQTTNVRNKNIHRSPD